MRILLLNQFYPPDVAATGQLLADLAEGLAREGHQVHVICSSRAYGGGELRPEGGAESEAGSQQSVVDKKLCNLRIHRVKATGFGRANILGRILDYLSFYILAMWKALWLPKMDACVALTTPPFISLVAILLQKLKGTKVILWTMDLYPEVPVAFGVLKENSLLHRILKRVSRAIYHRADRIISLGEVMTKRLIEAGAEPEKISTIHNWVPGEGIRPQPFFEYDHPLRRAWNLNGAATVMYSGNLGGGHELDTVVRAVGALDERERKNLRLLFVGKGKSRQALETLAGDLKLENVDFHDPVPLEQLGDCLAVGQVHIVSQKPGTQGLIVPSKIYGIMAAGRPILFIGPEDCEPAAIIHDSRAGFIIRSGDAEGLAHAIRLLTSDSGLRAGMGNLARDYYEKHFGRDQSVGRIIEVITGKPVRRREEIQPVFLPSRPVVSSGIQTVGRSDDKTVRQSDGKTVKTVGR